VRREVENVILTLGGGSSSRHHIQSIVDMLNHVEGDFNVNVIMGPLSDRRRVEVRTSKHPVNVISDPASMRELMLKADLAISAGGQTLFELCATGTPTIGIECASNQTINLRAFEATDALWFAGPIGENETLQRAIEMMQQLFENYETRTKMSCAQKRLVDGKGAQRTSSVMANMLS